MTFLFLFLFYNTRVWCQWQCNVQWTWDKIIIWWYVAPIERGLCFFHTPRRHCTDGTYSTVMRRSPPPNPTVHCIHSESWDGRLLQIRTKTSGVYARVPFLCAHMHAATAHTITSARQWYQQWGWRIQEVTVVRITPLQDKGGEKRDGRLLQDGLILLR